MKFTLTSGLALTACLVLALGSVSAAPSQGTDANAAAAPVARTVDGVKAEDGFFGSQPGPAWKRVEAEPRAKKHRKAHKHAKGKGKSKDKKHHAATEDKTAAPSADYGFYGGNNGPAWKRTPEPLVKTVEGVLSNVQAAAPAANAGAPASGGPSADWGFVGAPPGGGWGFKREAEAHAEAEVKRGQATPAWGFNGPPAGGGWGFKRAPEPLLKTVEGVVGNAAAAAPKSGAGAPSADWGFVGAPPGGGWGWKREAEAKRAQVKPEWGFEGPPAGGGPGWKREATQA